AATPGKAAAAALTETAHCRAMLPPSDPELPMPLPVCTRVPFACCLALCIAACATAPEAAPSGAAAAVVEGTIASIDTQPWAYDGNAVIRIDSVDRGSVAVALPARWNLCEAAPVEGGGVAVGRRGGAGGATAGEGGLVVGQDATHRRVPID